MSLMRMGFLSGCLACLAFVIGCGDTAEKDKKSVENVSSGDDDGHGHVHGGGHSHMHGPNGDVAFHIEEADLYAEITTNNQTRKAKITFCSADGHKEAAVKIENPKIAYANDSFDLTAVDPGEDGMASVYESEESDDLLALLKSRPNFEFEYEGKKLEVRLPRPH